MASGGAGDDSAAKPFHIVVAVDFSPASQNAFEHAASFYKPKDRITVLTIADPEKDYLPYDQRPTTIAEYYETRLVGMAPHSQWRVMVHTKKLGRPTREELVEQISKLHADLLVIGFVGRKGPKEDPTVMGSGTDYSLRSAYTTALVVKDAEPVKPSLFVVGIDGSARAHQAMEMALHLRRPGDKIQLIHVEDLSAQAGAARQFDADVVEAKYAALAGGLEGVTFQRVLKGATGVADTFLHLADEAGATYIMVGVDGLSAHSAGKAVHLGSVSDRVVRNARCHVFAVHPPNHK